jgi:RNA polymerase sigma-70 factor (ECF subfamily)
VSNSAIDDIYRRDRRRVFSTLVRLLGSFDRAEEAVQDAFRAAAERWPQDGVPGNPVAWLVSAGRFRAIDRLRRESRFVPLDENAAEVEALPDPAGSTEAETLEDDQLRLIFTCCHPSLSEEARIALTLREACGLTTEAIARSVLTRPAALAQRIVRAKAKIRDARIPYQVPDETELPARMASVLRVIYLIFNEGYSPSSGDKVTDAELSQEAIRLARLLKSLLPHAEVAGLLGLMLLQESRRAARESGDGELVLLDQQDRRLWDKTLIEEGQALVETALRMRGFGAYALQAAIAAVHAEAGEPGKTDWAQIVGLYDALLRIEPSPVIELNRAVAVSMRNGAEAGLAIVDDLLGRQQLVDYAPAHAVRAELCRRLGRFEEARAALTEALRLTNHQATMRHLHRQLDGLPAG